MKITWNKAFEYFTLGIQMFSNAYSNRIFDSSKLMWKNVYKNVYDSTKKYRRSDDLKRKKKKKFISAFNIFVLYKDQVDSTRGTNVSLHLN